MLNPILIEVTRAELVESVHRGAVAVTNSAGELKLAIGDVERVIYPRSAIKIVQALPMLETGAADTFGFGNPEIALACGSHTGSDRHVSVARGMLAKLGLDQACLACGAATPLGTKAAHDLAARGLSPTALHHNCSGKHAGMLAATHVLGGSTAHYADVDHPVQRHVWAALTDLAAQPLAADVCGTDGCSVPTWAMPLRALARLFAKIATGDGMSRERRAALNRALAACWAEPELVAGRGRVDTVVMAALPGRIYLKNGAEGVYCGALPDLGLGFALKIDDGAQRACAGAVMPLVERLLPSARGLVQRGVLRTAQGRQVGLIRTSPTFERALGTLVV